MNEALQRPPVMCPLCGRNPAGPKHRLYVCQVCHEDHTLEVLAKISRTPVSLVPATNYGGGAPDGGH